MLLSIWVLNANARMINDPLSFLPLFFLLLFLCESLISFPLFFNCEFLFLFYHIKEKERSINQKKGIKEGGERVDRV